MSCPAAMPRARGSAAPTIRGPLLMLLFAQYLTGHVSLLQFLESASNNPSAGGRKADNRYHQTALPVGIWNVDPVHSTANFAVKYMIGTFRGKSPPRRSRLEVGEDGSAVLTGSVPVKGVKVQQEDLRGASPVARLLRRRAHPRGELPRVRDPSPRRRGGGGRRAHHPGHHAPGHGQRDDHRPGGRTRSAACASASCSRPWWIRTKT